MTSIRHSKSFHMMVPVSELFPLFSPEGEKKWVPGWDYENVMGTTELSEDYVFLTRKHDHMKRAAIWIVKKYEPGSHFVQYYKIEPEEKIGVVTVKCKELEPGATEVQVTYRYMALSAGGERFVSEFSESAYERFIGEWQGLLANYFASTCGCTAQAGRKSES
jgi:hypothetical protein